MGAPVYKTWGCRVLDGEGKTVLWSSIGSGRSEAEARKLVDSWNDRGYRAELTEGEHVLDDREWAQEILERISKTGCDGTLCRTVIAEVRDWLLLYSY